MVKRSSLLASIAVVAILVLVAGCGSQPSSPSGSAGSQAAQTGEQKAQVQQVPINIATGTTGGVYYPFGGAIANVWNKYVPGVKASVQATAGTPQNIELMRSKQAEVAFGQNGASYYAYNGIETFKGKAYPDLRAMTTVYSGVVQIVARKDSHIKSVADLKGKRFVPGAIGSATEINSREVLSAYGLNYLKDQGEVNVKADFVDNTAAADLIKNKQADAYQISGGLPTASIMDTFASADVELVPLEPERIKEITRRYPWYFEVVIPAGTYKGQDKDVRTVAFSNLLICRADLPDDLVYNLTKALYDHHDDLVAAHKVATQLTIKDSVNGMIVPIHPGAARFLKEQGVNVEPYLKK